MKRWNTVAVIGVGLIGGSIGLALRRQQLAERVIGIGRNSLSLQKALDCGAVSETTTDWAQGLRQAQLIVVCTPVNHIVEHVQLASRACPHGAIITDAGSTKGRIVRSLEGALPPQVAFVGSHPLAGSEKMGPEAARHDLFHGCVVVLTPGQHTLKEKLEEVEQFWSSLGARTVTMSADDHDRAIATTSHVPHLVSAALAASTPQQDLALVAGGWLDTTRVASGSPELWKPILLENCTHVLNSLDAFADVLARFRAAIDQSDESTILELLQAGKNRRDAVGSGHPPGRQSA